MTYIIAEIGQNHNGSLYEATRLVDAAKEAGANAVKLTIRDLDWEMTHAMADQPYDSKNSYGDTYMKHREALELEENKVLSLANYIRNKDLDIVVTLCSHTLLKKDWIFHLLNDVSLRPSFIKVASRDITNLLLLDAISAYTSHRVILSTGLSDFPEIAQALQHLRGDVSIMHCVSKYPTPRLDAHLIRIHMLKEYFKTYPIGYSDHTLGNEACITAVAMGAEIIEKHITLNKADKGSDHICSADPTDFKSLVDDIRRTEAMIGSRERVALMEEDADIKKNRDKLMRSVCSALELKAGEPIKPQDLCLLSPGTGIPGNKIYQIPKCVPSKNISEKSTIHWEDLA